jgi:hypothetical protein
MSAHILEHLFNRLFGGFGLLHAHNKGGFANLHRITRILILHSISPFIVIFQIWLADWQLWVYHDFLASQNFLPVK